MILFRNAVVILAAAGVAASCTSEAGEPDVASAGAGALSSCKVFSAQLGRVMTPEEVGALGDPAAKRLLQSGCPQSLDAILQTLRQPSDCASPTIRATVVSERSLLLDRPDSSRAVLSQDCAGNPGDVFVSVFGLHAGAPSLPQGGAEVIGYDAAAGAFNYYVNEGGWKYMGSSRDAVSGGYSCGPSGDCLPKAAQKSRCFACHESGGLNMKELHAPWLGWSLGIHEDALFERFGAQLGQPQHASVLEVRVETANTRWNEERIDILQALGAEELLRPLFCTLTFNLEAAGLRGRVTSFPSEFFFEVPKAGELKPAFDGIGFSPGSVAIDPAVYSAAISGSGQRMVDAAGRPLKDADGNPIVEPPRAFVFPSKGDIDRRYIRRLVERKLVDQDFVLDVLNVDFARPVFSPDRCGLLGAAPRLSGAGITPASVREGFKANLAGREDPAARQLLANLSDPTDRSDHFIGTSRFLAACRGRSPAALAADVLRYNAHQKAAAKAHRASTPNGPQGIIEFAETLPVDGLGDTTASFDESDCILK